MAIHPVSQSTAVNLPLEEIDFEDQTFQVSDQTNNSDLEISIAVVGLINPPWVRDSANGWRIVSGFRRLKACSELGWEKIQTQCLPQETADATCACLAIADNALQRSLSLPEQIRASRLLFDHCADAPNLEKIAQAVGLAPNLKLLRQMRALADAPSGLSLALADGSVPFSMAVELIKRPAPEATAWADLFRNLRPSLNRQRELLSFVDDIVRRDDLKVEEVIATAAAEAEVDNPALDRPVRYNRLRSALRSRRYPNLAKAEVERDAALREIQLEPSMRLLPPANFEGRRCRLQLSFSERSEFEAQVKCVNRLMKDPTLLKLLS